ncbi:MAG: aspartate 1-decarboxylase [Candidatus Omnitrophica bacterium CG1_02_49_10]|nr:MAG: aspartate 1-decarboxylase [Candidatus Omnitrophica bacterium CG1_02_49_10]
MLRTICKSKIHNAVVTESNLKYQGSITVDSALLNAADIIPNEKVQVVNLNNGSRLETYVVPGRENSGVICMNGAAARWAEPGDKVIIISYGIVETDKARQFNPIIVFVGDDNKITEVKR